MVGVCMLSLDYPAISLLPSPSKKKEPKEKTREIYTTGKRKVQSRARSLLLPQFPLPELLRVRNPCHIADLSAPQKIQDRLGCSNISLTDGALRCLHPQPPTTSASGVPKLCTQQSGGGATVVCLCCTPALARFGLADLVAQIGAYRCMVGQELVISTREGLSLPSVPVPFACLSAAATGARV